ncbi:flagellar hook-associated protein FlgL [Christensenella tenuis]|uniref:Flagellar hook-associated protein FlgL n=1 Tax=Christensenella tenuis TaxID=2763033 RepID=A0ABR7ECI7_9FIRM|nr:flagellar hook-associated protein FlgL [Christensenella tenuis]MBC5646764.1 flagellar hook-associated protein FlgL [Christensenella tenuis]
MRITNSMMIDNLLTNLNAGLGRVSKYNSQLSSNRRIVNLSDDPVGVFNSLGARQQIRRLNQYQKNVTAANKWVVQTENAINEMEQTIVNIKELTTEAAGVRNEDDKKNIATQIEELMEHLLETCNGVIGDKHMFAGFNTTNAPFEAIRDGAGKLTGVLYNGYDLTLPGNAVILGKKIANTDHASNFQWTGSMTDYQKYSVSAAGDTLTFTGADGNQITHTISAQEIQDGKIDLSAEGLGTITWENSDPVAATANEIAGAIASAGSITTPSTAVIGERADASLQWKGEITGNEKYRIAVEGDTITFYNSHGSEVAHRQVTDADIAAGQIDLTAEGLGIVSWTGTPANPEELAQLIGSAEFVTSAYGEEHTQDIQFEIGYNMYFDVSFTGIDVVGTGEDNMFNVLINLVNDLNSGAPNEEISTYLTSLTNVQDRLITCMVECGTRTTKLETMKNRYSLDAISYEAARSDVEDIDQAKVIMDMKYSETIYKQALATGAMIIQPTLMDFLN